MKTTRWFTARKLLTVVGTTLAYIALWNGKMSGGDWVLAMAVFIAGHHAADLIKAWKGGG